MDHAQERARGTNAKFGLGPQVHSVYQVAPVSSMVCRGSARVICSGEKTSALLYDNHHPKGHHRHVETLEELYVFTTVRQLVSDFTSEASKLGVETK